MHIQYPEFFCPERGSTTPKKPYRDLDSTNCKPKTRPSKDHNIISRSAQKQKTVNHFLIPEISGFTIQSKGVGRPYSDLSSDDDEDIRRLSRTIKKLHFEEDPDRQRIEQEREKIEVSPFQIPEQMMMPHSNNSFGDSLNESRDKPLGPPKKLMKKESTFENISLSRDLVPATLYRLNSVVLDMGEANVEEYLGDNVYIKNILKRFSSIQNINTDNECDGKESRFDKDYEIVEIVGRCGSLEGYCFKCHNRLDRMMYFVKQIDNLDDRALELVRNQIEIYNSNQRNEFIRFYQSWTDEDKLYLVLEMATYTLEDLNQENKKLSEREIRGLIQDIASGLLYLKEKKEAAHLNIKPTNIINCRGNFKLTDMLFERSMMTKPFSKYSAPELSEYYIDGATDLFKCDVYSLGLSLLQNITDSQINDRKHMRRVLRCQFQYSPSLKKQLLRMISINPNNRPSLEELKSGLLSLEEQVPKAGLQRKMSL